MNHDARRAAASNRKRVKTPFARITSAASPVPRTISYRHPTKGLRFRRANPKLFLGLFHAFAPAEHSVA